MKNPKQLRNLNIKQKLWLAGMFFVFSSLIPLLGIQGTSKVSVFQDFGRTHLKIVSSFEQKAYEYISLIKDGSPKARLEARDLLRRQSLLHDEKGVLPILNITHEYCKKVLQSTNKLDIFIFKLLGYREIFSLVKNNLKDIERMQACFNKYEAKDLLLQDLAGHVERYINSIRADEERFSALIKQASVFIRDWALSFSLISLCLAGLTMLMVSRMIITPLANAVEFAESITHGNFRQKIEIDQPDEIGALAAALNKMALKLENQINTLAESEESLKEYMDAMITFNARLDIDGRIMNANKSALETISEGKKDDIYGSFFWDTPWVSNRLKVREQVKANVLKAAQGQINRLEVEVEIGEDRTFLPIDLFFHPVFDASGKIKYLIAEAHDISEMKKANRRLRIFSMIAEQAAEGIAIGTMKGIMEYINPAGALMHGYEDPNDIIGKPERMFHNDEQFEHDLKSYSKKVLELGAWRDVLGHVRKDGTTFPVETISVIFKDEEGNPLGLLGFMTDITERKKTEDALIESEKKYLTVVNQAQDAIVIIKESKFIYVNPKMIEFTGYTEDVLIDMDIMKVFTPESRLLSKRIYEQRLEGKHLPDYYEVSLIDKNKKLKPMEVNAGIIDYKGKKAILAFLRDISERKEAEKKLQMVKQKLLDVSRQAGMAEVANNVLHDVGNVLNSVNVTVTYLVNSLKEFNLDDFEKAISMLNDHKGQLQNFIEKDPQGRHLIPYLDAYSKYFVNNNKIMISKLFFLAENVKHIKDIILRQQSYSGVSEVIGIVSLSYLIENSLQINNSLIIESGINIRRKLKNCPQITTDIHKVLQILVNLVRNAIQSMIKENPPKKILDLEISKKGPDQVEVRVRDNGTGINPKDMEKIFSHGFTTKKDGHGFGLHSSFLEAKALGGNLRVQSDGKSKGALFILELPVN